MLVVPCHRDVAAACCTARHLALANEMRLKMECINSGGSGIFKSHCVFPAPPTAAVTRKVHVNAESLSTWFPE